MDIEKKKILKEREKAISFIYYAAAISALIAITFYIIKFSSRPFSSNPEDWGVFGDFIGGTLNPIFAFFSFILLLLNLTLQRQQLDRTEEQLDLNREELKLTREELKKAADAQVDSAKVMNEQLRTQDLQRFENLFFALITQLQNRVEHLEGRDVIESVHRKIYSKQLNNNSYRGIVELIYCIIQNVLNKFDGEEKNLELKDKYINIVKSITTVEMMHFLIRDVSDVVNTAEYNIKKDIINKVGMLSKISFKVDNYRMKFWLIKSAYSLFDSDAFVENPEYLKLKDIKLKSIFYSRYPLTFEEALHRFFKSKLKKWKCN